MHSQNVSEQLGPSSVVEIEGYGLKRNGTGSMAICHVGCHTNTIKARAKDQSLISRSLEADQAALEPATKYVINKNGFTPDQANQAKREFLNYMLLVNTSNTQELHPSPEADIFWHALILHTMIYAPWCERHFGYFVHHVPSDKQSCSPCGGGPPPPTH